MKEFNSLSAETRKTATGVFKTLLFAGLLVGTLDILAASTDYYIATGKNPTAVLKFVASGVFGKKAFSSGNGIAWMGLLFHYIIAFTFATFFFWIYPKIKVLAHSRIITGIAYGLFIWSVMNLLVVPLSNTPPLSHKVGKMIKAMLILIAMIGIPLSFIAYWCFYKKSKPDVTPNNLIIG